MPDERLIIRRVDQVRLVEAKNRGDLPLLGTGQVAIDQMRLQLRLNDRHDDDELIHIGDDHMFPATR